MVGFPVRVRPRHDSCILCVLCDSVVNRRPAFRTPRSSPFPRPSAWSPRRRQREEGREPLRIPRGIDGAHVLRNCYNLPRGNKRPLMFAGSDLWSAIRRRVAGATFLQEWKGAAMDVLLFVSVILVGISVVWVGMQIRGIREEMGRKEDDSP